MALKWDGNPGAINGATPFGFYDAETTYQTDGPKVATWCANRLGYPIQDVELISGSFYSVFEESVTEYSSQVNQFNIRENMLALSGAETGSNFTHREISPSLGGMITTAENYGTEAGSGGNVDWKKGSIDVVSGSQDYDLDALWANVSESSADIEIKRIHHEAPPAIVKYFDPFVGSTFANQGMLDMFGWGNYSPGVQFIMSPLYADILRLQAIEFNDQIRKSGYSFELINNKLKIFPMPSADIKLWFEYVVTKDRSNPLKTAAGRASDYSNVPYANMKYTDINDVGKQWIKKYTLALSKELLGSIRSKYANIPIPGAEIALNGADLKQEAQTEKDALVEQLRENLLAAARRAQLEKDKEESENLMETLKRVPLKIYIG